MNKVILLGHLARDPELRQTQSNVWVASFTVAVNRTHDRTEADYIDCVAWRNTAEFVSKYFAKGKPILVEGRLQVRNYEDKQGVKRRVYEVLCNQVSFVEGAARSEDTSAPTFVPPIKSTSAVSLPTANAGSSHSSRGLDGFEEVQEYDDLPF